MEQGHEKTKRGTRIALPLVCVAASALAALTLLWLAAPARATENHTFDPLLSLRGDCSSSALDEVPDPGLCPGTAGVDHPPKAFEEPCGVATDRHGNIYVSSLAQGAFGTGTGARIDVFNAAGEYLTEFKDKKKPCKIAVDSEGHVYVAEYVGKDLVRFDPEAYPPAKGSEYEGPTIVREYTPQGEESPPIPTAQEACESQTDSLAVDPADDHLYVTGCHDLIFAYGSAAEGNPLLGGVDEVQRLAVDATGGSFKLASLNAPRAVTADLTAGSPLLSSILAATGTGTLSAGSTALTPLSTTSGTFEQGRPISGPGISEGTGTGDISAGSDTIANLATDSGAFAVGQTVFAPGVPEGTTITALGASTLTLSKAAGEFLAGAPILAATTIEAVTRGKASEFIRLSLPASASGAGVELASKGIGGAGRALIFGPGLPAGTKLVSFGKNQLSQGSGVLVGTEGQEANFSAGSNIVTHVFPPYEGVFAAGQTVLFGPAGLPESATIVAVETETETETEKEKREEEEEKTGEAIEEKEFYRLTLSDPATETKGNSSLKTAAEPSVGGSTLPLTVGNSNEKQETAAIPHDASAATVQAALEALPRIGAGNVSVSGGPGGPGAADPYLIAFQGRLADTDIPPLGAEGSGLSGPGAAATLATQTNGSNGEIGSGGEAASFTDIAVHGANHDIYLSGYSIDGQYDGGTPKYARAFVFDDADGHLKCEIDGSGTPQGGFGFSFGNAGVAVDQSNGDLYLDDVTGHGVVDRFDSECGYLGQLEHSLIRGMGNFGAGLALDAPFPGQGGYDSPNQGHLFVAQGEAKANFHLYAFAPAEEEPLPPEVQAQAVAAVTDTEATLRAEINPQGRATSYRFQYISQADWEADGESYGAGTASVPAPEADAGSDAFFKSVSVALSGLQPATAYRFRAVATSHCYQAEPEVFCTSAGEGGPGEEGADAAFSTYGPDPGLPDARAYELVSPPDTGGLVPTSAYSWWVTGNGTVTPTVSPDGQSVIFGTEGGSLSAFDGVGVNDVYVARRGTGGWQTSSGGLSGTQTAGPGAGGAAPDHRYSFWYVDGEGTLPRGSYLRGPDGAVEPIGTGSLGTDSEARGVWLGPGAERLVFVTDGNPVQLEPEAPAASKAIYERSADGPTEVLSLLPGELTPSENATYKGTSADGSATAFALGKSLYLRRGGETRLIAAADPVFAGVSAHGERVAYLRPNAAEPERPNPVEDGGTGLYQGEIFSYDTTSEASTAVPSGEEAMFVNVSPDGSHVYFLSPERLDGEAGEEGGENLYAWDAGSEAVRFIATVTERDVYGEHASEVTLRVTDGLGLWTGSVASGRASRVDGPGADPSRTSADGSALLFASRAKLTAYDNAGHAEIYRYDAGAGTLACLSCTPTGVPAASGASLQLPPAKFLRSLPPVTAMSEVINLTPDGARAFFQSAEPLVLGDVDGLLDVYEWEAPGKGSCTEQSPAYRPQSGGCIYLISGGRSASEDYLYGMAPDGSDVVILSGDLLSFEDRDKTHSLYDVRVGGGFPAPTPPPGECLGEACQPAAVAPDAKTPASAGFQGAGNVTGSAPSCAPRARRAKRLARRARHLRRRAGRIASHRAGANRARQMSRAARRLAGRAKRSSAAAKRCRRRARAGRRAAR